MGRGASVSVGGSHRRRRWRKRRWKTTEKNEGDFFPNRDSLMLTRHLPGPSLEVVFFLISTRGRLAGRGEGSARPVARARCSLPDPVDDRENTRAVRSGPFPRFSAAKRSRGAHLLGGELSVSEANQDSQEGVVRTLVVGVDPPDALQQVVAPADRGLVALFGDGRDGWVSFRLGEGSRGDLRVVQAARDADPARWGWENLEMGTGTVGWAARFFWALPPGVSRRAARRAARRERARANLRRSRRMVDAFGGGKIRGDDHSRSQPRRPNPSSR